MLRFVLRRPVAVNYKINGVEGSEFIATIDVGPLFGEPDEIELAARLSLVRSGTHQAGTAITIAELGGYDVSSGLREAYRVAHGKARAVLSLSEEGATA